MLTVMDTGDEAARCVAQGKQESPDLPLDETIAIMEVMVSDACKRELGVPADGCHRMRCGSRTTSSIRMSSSRRSIRWI